MNVGMVSTFAQKCGIATYSGYLTDALKNEGIDTLVFAEEFNPKDSMVHDFKSPYTINWNRNKPFTQLIEDSGIIDILHVQHQFGLFPNTTNNTELYSSIHKPIVTTLHDVVPPHPNFTDYMKTFLEKSSAIIVHTKACYDLLTEWGLDTKYLIPHGTKLMPDMPKSEARKLTGLPENAKIILSWGFIWESKGVLDLVKILAEIKKTYPEAILIHAGGLHPSIQGSDYLRNILKTAIQLKLSPKDLVITQWVPEDQVPNYLSSADVIVLNYMRGSASASGAGHRALAAHRPIVKTNDYCIEEIPGYTVERFHPEQLCEGILKVLQDKILQKKFIADSEKAAQEMSWEAVAKQHKEVYLNINLG